ncbi:MAG: DNA alkylation repair protein [Chloroflexi bacterium]|nr:DNA alkylation repair protein [Chloroflexota bacterium]
MEEIRRRLVDLGETREPELRRIRQGFSRRIATTPPEDVLALALALLENPESRFRFMAYELINKHRPTLRSLDTEALIQLSQGMDTWEAVDTFGRYLSGPAWRERQIPDELVHSWTRSEDRWWRRAALVSTVPLNNKSRGGDGDPHRTLQVCDMLASDRDDMVYKALSWALRELIKHDKEGVTDFLRRHDDDLAARVKREVTNKLKTGLKNPKASRP